MLIIERINKKEFQANRVKVQCDWLLAKPLLYTIRDRPFDFRVGGGGGRLFFFSSRFSSDRKPENFFFSQSESQNNFFRTKQKQNIFFSKQHICSKCTLLDLYVRVFLEPNIHGYIVYMFVLGPRMYVHIKTFLISAI